MTDDIKTTMSVMNKCKSVGKPRSPSFHPQRPFTVVVFAGIH